MGIKSVTLQLENFNRILPKETEQAIYEGVKQFFVPLAKAYAPVRTGRLKKSIDAKRIRGGALFYAMAPYSAWVEYGAGGGRARLPIGSRYPRPFMSSAIGEGMPSLLRYVASRINQKVIASLRFKHIATLRGVKRCN